MSYAIHKGDCITELHCFDEGSVDVIITSPPYKEADGYSDKLMENCFRELFRVLKKDSLFFLNFGHLAEDKARPFKVCSIAMDMGFQLNETITWVKNHYKPIQGKRRMNNLSEFIFLFYKGKMPLLDRLAIGVPYVDKSNARRFNKGKDLHCAGNVWPIKYATINSSEQKLHHDRFPIELPERCLKLCGYPVQTVLDPFCGSSTTGEAAIKLGKIFIGIDKDGQCCHISRKRLLQATKNLLARQRGLPSLTAA